MDSERGNWELRLLYNEQQKKRPVNIFLSNLKLKYEKHIFVNIFEYWNV